MSHGGRVWEASRQLGLDHSQILDFSANMNPFGTPKEVLSAMIDAVPELSHYPDAECRELVSRLAFTHRIERCGIVPANGAAEAIHLAPIVMGTRRGIVLAPGFSDYTRALKAWNLPVEYFPEKFAAQPDRLAKALTEAASSACEGDTIFLSNPCNPTGELVRRDVLVNAMELAQARGATMLVDESFGEFAGKEGLEASVIDLAARSKGLIVIRSFTKFYAIPGLRLGYAILSESGAVRMRTLMPSWNVNHIAQRAGLAALALGVPDDTVRRIAGLRDSLIDALNGTGAVQAFPSHCNFVLARIIAPGYDAKDVARDMRSRGILIRDCSDFEGLDRRFIRVAVKLQEENSVLVTMLAAILGG